jgi:chromosome segregation protein
VRLTQLRLSGFKSFVDPTTLQISRQLVGIVGPNGCGKSNVIDAVRWVLGESKASELRGENMHDVIFNGSGTRKPAGRASVELMFDNSQGRLGGPWGRFAELSVKRVLSRDGQSSYYINNQHVRRKDVYDVFMGTGLGPRAYAIIGQGMISRVIESKPEELRVFLEEAAGVSKYRERRRETENRLTDARENLARVDDIRLELGQRIEQLSGQAEVAQVYQDKVAQRADKQALLLALRRQESLDGLSRHRLARGEQVNALDALVAQGTAMAREVEEARASSDEAQSLLSAAQAAVFEINTQIAGLEADNRAQQQNKDRATQTIAAAQAQLAALQSQQQQGAEEREHLAAEMAQTAAHLAQAQTALSQAQQALMPKQQAFEQANESLNEARTTAAASEAELRGLVARLAEQQAMVQRLSARLGAAKTELSQLETMDPTALPGVQAQLQEAKALEQSAQQTLAQLTTRLAEDEAALESARGQAQSTKAEFDRLTAEHAAQSELLAAQEANDQMDPWLARHQFADKKKLWSALRVEDGWQTAVGAALAEKMSAISPGSGLSDLLTLAADQPPGRVVFYQSPAQDPAVGADRLASKIQGQGEAASMARFWLGEMLLADSLEQAIAKRGQLQPHQTFVTQDGHMVGSHDLRLHGQSAADGSGLLAQRDRVEGLVKSLRVAELAASSAKDQLSGLEARVQEARRGLETSRATLAKATSRCHELSLIEIRLQEKAQRLETKSAGLQQTIDATQAELQSVEQTIAQIQQTQSQADAQRQALQASVAAAQQAAAEAQQQREAAQQSLRTVEASLQEHRLSERSQQARQEALVRAAQELQSRMAETQQRETQAQHELQSAEQALAQSPLQQVLGQRVSLEQALTQARQYADEKAHATRELDEKRLSIDREAIPIRERIGHADAALAAAQATIDQIDQQLADQGIDLEPVCAQWPNRMPPADLPKPASLQAEVNRLNREIEALGPVNLAALSELEQAKERQGFLDAQATDLMSAVETLEDAIRKIDRESRALLQSTYDTVNANFGRLFPTLFGGGEARLVLTGEEILDSGVQVMAQPPGKKNTSIHLLSGGEKALTATALVFALFQLNPAPFCLLDEVDAPLDDPNTERLCRLVKEMSTATQFVFITHNKIAMELAEHLVGVTMQEQGVSRLVAVDLDAAGALAEAA